MKYDCQLIEEWLKARPVKAFGPTQIGIELFNLPYEKASSAIMPSLKKLLKEQKIIREKGGKYRAKCNEMETHKTTERSAIHRKCEPSLGSCLYLE